MRLLDFESMTSAHTVEYMADDGTLIEWNFDKLTWELNRGPDNSYNLCFEELINLEVTGFEPIGKSWLVVYLDI